MAVENVVPFRRPLVDRDGAKKQGGCQEQDDLIRIHRLKRYVSPQIAEMVLLSSDEDGLWESHRREITVVSLDLTGFVSFTENTEPEEVMALLRGYHAVMGRLIFKFEGTLERFSGDGIMVYFNDPIPCRDHTVRAVRMALEMQDNITGLRAG